MQPATDIRDGAPPAGRPGREDAHATARLRVGLAGSVRTRPAGGGPETAPLEVLTRLLAAERWDLALIAWVGTDRAGTLDRDRLLAGLDRDIAILDRLLSAQVDAILHQARFQSLEASWRGLRYLVESTQGDELIRIRILNIGWVELCRDLERALEFDQSQMFQKIYEDEFGTPGGEPYSLLLGDYAVQHRMDRHHTTDDVAALQAMAGVCAAAFAPMVVGATPALLGLDHFGELSAPIHLAGLFDGPEYDRWRSLRKAEDSRFLGVMLPNVLMRDAHRDDGRGSQPFRYAEDVSAPDASTWLWAPPVYAFGRVAVRAFLESRWFANIRGVRRDELGGGLVEDLPAPDYGTDRPGLATRIPVTVAMPEVRESELAEIGLIPLAAHQHTPFAVIRAVGSLQEPLRYDRPEATVNARLSAMLHYMMCVSRFAHLLKVMVRDKVGSFASPAECEVYLHDKIIQYVQSRATASYEEKARRPLREASVSVREIPGRPGTYACTCHIVPHFQIDQVSSSFRLELDTTPLRRGT